jgi:hypothetical protein
MTGAGNWRTLARISLPLALPAVGARCSSVRDRDRDLSKCRCSWARARASASTHRDFLRHVTHAHRLGTCRDLFDGAAAGRGGAPVLLFPPHPHGERYQTITGKDYRPRRIDLGRWRYFTCTVACCSCS